MAGRGVAEPALRDEVRLADGVAGMSPSPIAGVDPLLEAALLVARVVRLVDMMYVGSLSAWEGSEISEYCEHVETLSSL